jgi:hypothetical protein
MGHFVKNATLADYYGRSGRRIVENLDIKIRNEGCLKVKRSDKRHVEFYETFHSRFKQI